MGEPNRQQPKAPNEKKLQNFTNRDILLPIEVLIKP